MIALYDWWLMKKFNNCYKHCGLVVYQNSKLGKLSVVGCVNFLSDGSSTNENFEDNNIIRLEWDSFSLKRDTDNNMQEQEVGVYQKTHRPVVIKTSLNARGY